MKRDPLKQYVSLRQSLLKKKAALETELAQINQALGHSPVAAAVAAAPAKAAKAAKAEVVPVRRKRAKNATSLREAVLAATKAKPLSKADILAAIDKAGYVFSAKSPMSSLNTLLYSDKAFENHDGKFGPA